MTMPRDAVGRFIFELSMENPITNIPSLGDERHGWHGDDDSIEYPNFKDVDTIDVGTTDSRPHHIHNRVSFDDYEGLTLNFSGEVSGRESRKVARATRHHPAEYENRDVPLGFVLVVPLENPFKRGHLIMERR